MKLYVKKFLGIILIQICVSSSFGIFLPRSSNPYENILQLGIHNYINEAQPVEGEFKPYLYRFKCAQTAQILEGIDFFLMGNEAAFNLEESFLQDTIFHFPTK